MSDDFLHRIQGLSPKRLALLALELHEQLESARHGEAIAVIGLGCRFPGAADPQAFWELLEQGRDAIREVPPDRWVADTWFDADVDAPGRMSVRHGGFLDRIDGFDAAFFGISPREALTMDPQQRLVLEVAWESLEHAGLAPERLSGSPTGVFIGVCNSDHSQRVIERGNDRIDAYMASGNAHSVVSGRVAYFLGLQGPALSIDTACSSSLVALHIACLSLRRGESRIALAGGVNLMCSPHTTVALTKAHMLAPDGRCKTFDAAADGFARGEGCGMLVLKRLADAQADGDRILAVIRGSAANQDGRSGGLTVPNGPAQEAVIRAALADARLEPGDIDYVEAHGTGTTLGDPIEVRALGRALGAGRTAEAPLWVGSVKTNFGHLESAAGIAGVIKAVLALQHERIPPHLHFHQPSPHIPWDEFAVRVSAQGRAWPRDARPRRAGVSSFGFSGTNAHVIVEEAPPIEATVPAVARPWQVLPLSARSPDALRALAQRFADTLRPGGPSLAEVAGTAGRGRSHFAHRLAVVAADAAAARQALLAHARGETHPTLLSGEAMPGQAPELVFLFTGQGAQYPGMGHRLEALSPVYREVIDGCDRLLGADAQGRTLRSVLIEGDGPAAPIHDTAWTQPALFALEMALLRLWQSWGIAPSAVIGHSLGEYAAACAAGVFSLQDGLRLVAERGRLMRDLPPGGAMAAFQAPAEQIEHAVRAHAGRLSIAAFNAADSVVVSGDAEALDTLLAELAAHDVQGQRLFVSLAAHSPRVEPAMPAMKACAERVAMQPPRLPVAWNVTGGPLGASAPDAGYWQRHLREPVRFGAGIAWLHGQGYHHFLEIGPHPTLSALAERALPAAQARFVGSMRRGKDDWHELMRAVAALYVQGAPIDWAALCGPDSAPPVALPTYPFERSSYWIDTATTTSRPLQLPSGASLLCGARLPTALPTFELLLTPQRPAWMGEHRVHGAALAAAPVFLEMAQACAAAAFGAAARRVTDFAIVAPLVLGEAGRVVQLHFIADAAQAWRFEIHSRAIDIDGDWQRHASGRLLAAATPSDVAPPVALESLRTRLGHASRCDEHYERLASLGISLGKPWRGMVTAHGGRGEVLVRLQRDEALAGDRVVWAHPAALDAALQCAGLALAGGSDEGQLYLLSAIESVQIDRTLPPSLWCHAVLRGDAADAAQRRADIRLYADDGTMLCTLSGVVLRRAPREALQRALGPSPADELGYRVDWEPAPAPAFAAPHLGAPSQFMPGLAPRFDALAREHGTAIYAELLPELDALSAMHVGRALDALGFDATPGRRFVAADEATRLRIQPRHHRLFGRLLQMLAEDGLLRAEDGVWTTLRRIEPGDVQARHASAQRRFGDHHAELGMLQRCGSRLADVLRGDQDPLQLLFPGGSFAEARKLYVESPYARTFNGALAEAVAAALSRLPQNARLRVLEIGAGTGGTTGYLLPMLPAERTEYTFTDLSPLFLERAQTQFSGHAALRTRLLDIERDPVAQGFERGRHDIVIAANVLHACADLAAAVRHVRDLLAPGGLMLLLEGLAPERWVDLSFGLTEGWWRFDDPALRPDYPLVDRATWSRLLGELGFDSIHALPEPAPSVRGIGQQALIVARAPRPARRWTLVDAPAPLARALELALCARGDTVTTRTGDDSSPLPAADEWLYLGATALADLPSAGAGACEQRSVTTPLSGLTALVASPSAGRAWLVTQGAHRVADEAATEPRWQRPLWGLGRVFALEQPARWGGAIDLPPGQDAQRLARTLVDAIDADDGEDQTAWRRGERWACRLHHAPLPAVAPPALRADATYLVTGGFGGLGLQVAGWLVERGARHVALLGRHARPGAEGVRVLEALGARIHTLQADVAEDTALRALLHDLESRAPPVRGVLHLAADLSSAPLHELGAAQVAAMLRPKIDGTLVLERLAAERGMDFLVLFSSTTALLGAAGLAHYAAANLFLDATAEQARAAGRPVLSIGWGTWEAMRLASRSDQRSFVESGLEPMDNRQALDALGRLIGAGAAHAVVARVDWGRLKSMHEARRARPFLRHLDAPSRAEAAPTAAGVTPLAEKVAAAPAALRRDLIVEHVQREVAAVLALPRAEDVPPTTGLFDLGMDSLMAVELKRRLERAVGRQLPSTLTFNYPHVAALAGFLDGQLADLPAAPAPPAPEARTANVDSRPLDALSDEELEQRLLARLSDVR